MTTVDKPVALLNHEDQKQTHNLTCQIFTKTGLVQCSIVQVIRSRRLESFMTDANIIRLTCRRVAFIRQRPRDIFSCGPK